MSTTFTSDTFLDLVATTTKKFQRGKFSDIAKQFRNHYAMDLMRENKQSSTGQAIQFNIAYRRSSQAAWVDLNQVLNATIEDFSATGSVPWKQCNAHWAIEEMSQAMNSGPEQLVNMMKMRRYKCFTALADLFEAAWWAAPVSGAKTPYGLRYWIVKTGASSTFGFNGTTPSGFSDVGGLDPTAANYSDWKNGNATYVNVSKDDLVKLMREAYVKTSFTPPFPYPSAEGDSPTKKKNTFRFYTNYTVLEQLEGIGENQNQNLGKDLAPMDGMIAFRGVPVVWVDYLASDTTNPVYGLNFDCWETHFLKGYFMKEQEPIRLPNQPLTVVTHVWNSMNYVCVNRKEGGFVLATA